MIGCLTFFFCLGFPRVFPTHTGGAVLGRYFSLTRRDGCAAFGGGGTCWVGDGKAEHLTESEAIVPGISRA